MTQLCQNCGALQNKDVTLLVEDDDDYDRDTVVRGTNYCPYCGEEL